jgi:RNA polymerase sigma-B factor
VTIEPQPLANRETRAPLLGVSDDARLLEHYAAHRDTATRDALVERFLPLAHHLARRYRSGNQSEDVMQIAALGLLKAIDRFDPARGIAFSSYAMPTILGEIKRYFRDKGWTVRVPRELQERVLTVNRTTDELETELGRPPTAAQIAERLDMTVEQILEARLATEAHHGTSLDRSVSGADDEVRTLGESLGVEDHGYARAEDAATVDTLTAILSERDRLVLHLRFQEDLTQEEIGSRLGVSQMHVSRIIRQSIARIRAQAGDHPG